VGAAATTVVAAGSATTATPLLVLLLLVLLLLLALLALLALILLKSHLYISWLDFILEEAEEESQVRGSGLHKGFKSITVRLVFFIAQEFVVGICGESLCSA